MYHHITRSRIIILDALLKLRQACCDPRLVKTPAARKAKGSAKLAELLQERKAAIAASLFSEHDNAKLTLESVDIEQLFAPISA